MRVVCLLPSATESLAFIGGTSLIVGRSHECDFPPLDVPVLTSQVHAFENSRQMHEAVSQAMRSESHGNGLYSIDKDLLYQLEPDLIITQSLCSVCSIDAVVVERLAMHMPKPPTILNLDPSSIEDVIDDLERIGRAVGMEEEGKAAANGLRMRLQRSQELVRNLGASPVKVAFLEWTDPIFPGGHWTPQLIQMAGGSHPLNPSVKGGAAPPSFEITPESVVESDPDWIIICPCGLDIDTAIKESQGIRNTPWWRGLRAVVENRVAIVDGNQHFNRPGPRLIDALEWLVSLLHNKPGHAPQDFPWKMWKQPTHAPDLKTLPPPRDIEELHQSACDKGLTSYVDPKSGYQVLTSLFLAGRDNCCGNKCRHCPYGHFRVQRSNRTNVPSQPVLCDPKLLPESSTPVLILWPRDGLWPSKEIKEVKETPGKAPVLVGQIMNGSKHEGTYLLTDPSNGTVFLSQAFECCMREGVPIIIVPQQEGRTSDPLVEASELLKKRGFSLIEKSVS